MSIAVPKDTETNKLMFREFIENSNVIFIKSGLNGLVFKCEINNDYKSSYYSSRVSRIINKPITTLYIKLCIITNEQVKFKFINIEPDIKPDNELKKKPEYNQHLSINLKTFAHELTCHKNIINNTISDLNSCSPMCIYYEYNKFSYINNFYSNLYTVINSIRIINNNQIKLDDIKYGLIVLEEVTDIVNFIDYLYIDDITINNNYIMKTACAIFALLTLVYDGHYNHGDYHIGNCLITSNGNNYFVFDENDKINNTIINKSKFKNYRAYIIDFCRSSKLNEQTHKIICDLIDKYKQPHNDDYKKLQDILTHIYNCGSYINNEIITYNKYYNSDNHNDDIHNIFEWILLKYKKQNDKYMEISDTDEKFKQFFSNISKTVLILFKARERAITTDRVKIQKYIEYSIKTYTQQINNTTKQRLNLLKNISNFKSSNLDESSCISLIIKSLTDKGIINGGGNNSPIVISEDNECFINGLITLINGYNQLELCIQDIETVIQQQQSPIPNIAYQTLPYKISVIGGYKKHRKTRTKRKHKHKRTNIFTHI